MIKKFQVENPYVFKINSRLVQIGFTENGKTSEDRLTNVLKIFIDNRGENNEI